MFQRFLFRDADILLYVVLVVIVLVYSVVVAYNADHEIPFPCENHCSRIHLMSSLQFDAEIGLFKIVSMIFESAMKYFGMTSFIFKILYRRLLFVDLSKHDLYKTTFT